MSKRGAMRKPTKKELVDIIRRLYLVVIPELDEPIAEVEAVLDAYGVGRA